MLIKPTLFAACDVKYFLNHGLEFINSAVNFNNKVKIIVFPNLSGNHEDFINDIHTFYLMVARLYKNEKIKELCEIIPIETKLFFDLKNNLNIDEEDYRSFYSIIRFIILPKYVEEFPYLILDIDSIINKEIFIDDSYDIGLFLRENNNDGGNEYEINGMKIAAGAVFLNKNTKSFIKLIHDYFIENEIKWFCDQHSLYNAYLKYKNNYNIVDFSKIDGFLDWEFKNSNATIYTGKGDRKYNNQDYLNIKNRYSSYEKN